jgi:hypothetical protein
MRYISIACVILSVIAPGLPSQITGSEPTSSSRSIEWDARSIFGPVTVQNETVIISGNITVEEGADLSFIGCDIAMNPSRNGSLVLKVMKGGTLTIDNSSLQSVTPYGYDIRLYDGSSCHLRKSHIEDFGYFCFTDFWHGIVTESKDLVIDGCTLNITGGGILIPSSGSTTILNSTFHPGYFYTYAGTYICSDIIYIDSQSYLRIENSTIIGEYSSDLVCGPRVLPRGTIILKNTQIYQCNIALKPSSGLIENCTFVTNCTEGYAGAYIRTGDHKVPIKNCTFRNDLGYGVEFFSSTIMLKDCICTGGVADISLDDYGNIPDDRVILELINTSYDSVKFSNNLHEIREIAFLDVAVIGQRAGTGIDNATVNITSLQGKPVFENRTGPDGRLSGIELASKTITMGGTKLNTPHVVHVSRGNGTAPPAEVNILETRNITIVFDDLAPTLNITYPPDGFMTNSTSLEILGTTEPDARLTLDGKSIYNDNGMINQTVRLYEGNNTFVFKASDQNGNTAEVSRTITSITRLPTVIVDEPRDWTVTNRTPVRVAGRTDGARVEINHVPVELNATGDFAYDYAFLKEGLTTLTITAWDIVNNTDYVRVRVTYDATPPDIEIADPPDGSLTNQSAVNISGQTRGASYLEVDGVKVNISDQGAFTIPVGLVEGNNSFSFVANDLAGNVRTINYTLVMDSAIDLQILQPADNLLTNNRNVTISGRTEPGAKVLVKGIQAQNDNGTFSAVISLAEGEWTVNVSATDLAGNSILRQVHITIDLTPPEIVLLQPANLTSNMSDIKIKVRTEAGASPTINGTSMKAEGNGIFSIDVRLVPGPNNFTISAKDRAGNTNTTVVTIDYTPPVQPTKPRPPVKTDTFPIWALPAVIMILIVTVATMLILRRRKKPA